MKILKFGGSSVGSPDSVRRVLQIIKNAHSSTPVVVVVSAFEKVTNQLLEAGNKAASGDSSYKDILGVLEERHLAAVKALLPVTQQSSVLATVKASLNELEDVLQGVYLVQEFTPRTQDFILSFGERLSAYILSEALKSENVKAQFFNSHDLIITDDKFGSARVLFDQTYETIAKSLSFDSLPVVTGFIGTTKRGEYTTLGRGGSDYTASLIGAALNAQEIEIWTDVDGVMTADPRKVPQAFPLPALTYVEAMELSHFGAKVIYPPTMQPAMTKGIPIRIRNTFNPDFPGTIISTKANAANYLVTGISSINKITLLRIQGSGLIGVAGISKRLFSALASRSISVILITQASSEHTISIAIEPQNTAAAVESIHDEFRLELSLQLVDPLVVEEGLSVISVVGENMRHTPGIAARLFSGLGRNAINISAIAQGSSELNISLIVSEADETKALNVVHDEFFLSDTRRLNLFIVGTGLIGGTLLEQIETHGKNLKQNHAIDLQVVAIANSKKMVKDRAGLALSVCRELLEKTEDGVNIDQFVKELRGQNLPNSIFVDCTASEEVIKHYPEVLRAGVAIVTPNKRAQASEYKFYREIKDLSRLRNAQFLYETSVGAGLPIINTLNDLLKSGDEIIKIEAILSGTLSYLFNTFSLDHNFSELVFQAKKLGFTEPDPRDDLEGVDVCRKILILARETGAALELGDVLRESLVPAPCAAAKTVDEFFRLLKDHDNFYKEKLERATKENKKLRYIATFENGIARASLKEVESTHPFFNLSGSDNMVSFTTLRYRERPLVIRGPGAGAAVTAAGVLADIVRVASYV